MKRIQLSDGTSIPAVGLGTFRSEKEEGYQSVLHALRSGYRHVDTAVAYYNEEEVGRGIADSGVSRSDIFITTKLWNDASTFADTVESIDASLRKLRTEYVDLYLIHWPGFHPERNAEVWRAFEEAQKAGKIRSLGISNFRPHHIEVFLKSVSVKPVVNQVECHVWLPEFAFQEYCRERGMVLEAYAPLVSDRVKELLADETMKEIAGSHGKTVPQVAIRWLIQRDIVALPKSITPSRLEENIDVFDFALTDEEMGRLKGLNRAMRTFPDSDNFTMAFPEASP
jgi:diketogulonate reductase-like aldo/keto reductase